jgi:hypothetical protein
MATATARLGNVDHGTVTELGHDEVDQYLDDGCRLERGGQLLAGLEQERKSPPAGLRLVGALLGAQTCE